MDDPGDHRHRRVQLSGFPVLPGYSKAHGKEVSHFFPTPQATKRARERVRTILGNGLSLVYMVEQINYRLRGWAAYYARTHASEAFDELQSSTNQRIRRHLRSRRHRSCLGRYKEVPDRFLYLAYIRRGRIRHVTPATTTPQRDPPAVGQQSTPRSASQPPS